MATNLQQQSSLATNLYFRIQCKGNIIKTQPRNKPLKSILLEQCSIFKGDHIMYQNTSNILIYLALYDESIWGFKLNYIKIYTEINEECHS